MNIEIHNKGTAMLIAAAGDIDHHSAEALREKVDSAYERSVCKHIIFDFTGVTFMDSSGIGFLIGRYKNAEKRGGIVSIAGMNDETKRIFQISGLSKIIRNNASVREAETELGVR